MGRRRAFLQAQSYGGRIYSLGGFFAHAAGVRCTQVESFEIGTWAGRKEQPLLMPRAWHTSARLASKVFVIGGNNGMQHTRSTECIDLGDGPDARWRRGPDMKWRRYTPAAAAACGTIVVAGGYGTTADTCPTSQMDFTSSVELLAHGAHEWVSGPELPFKAARMAMAAINGRIYCAGGYDGSAPLREVVSLDPRTRSWMPEPLMNLRRSYLGLVGVGPSLVALGGFNGERFSDTVEIWDTRMSAWRVARPLPFARAYMGAVAF